jgi:hypothetical protein
MLKPTDPTGLRPLTPVEAPAAAKKVGDARDESVTRLTQIALGKEYSATVLARLQDGQFLVRLANTAARMPLPTGTNPGDRLSLTLISHQPRPTFLLGSGLDAGSTPTSVSTTGRLIDHMRQLAQQQGLPNRVLGGPPLLQAPAASSSALAMQIAHALRNMLDTSGLFYESHVGEWASDERSLETLMREPQARLQQQANETAMQKLPLAAGKTAVSVLPDELASSALNAQQADTVLRLAAEENPQAARMVNLQLDLLEHRRAAWEGELWPGQKLLWEVSEEAPEGEQSAATGGTGAVWQSKLRIELPELGAVSALLQLQGDHVRVHLDAASAESAALLQSGSTSLADALEAAGSALDLLTVKQDEDA